MELKPCPFCGSEVTRLEEDGKLWVQCDDRNCPLAVWMSPEEWNTRPLEDALQAKLNVAVEALHRAENFNIDKYEYEVIKVALKNLEE